MVTGMSALERVLLPLPKGFDPSRHSKSLPAALAKKRGEGPDDPPWEIESLNLPEGTATLVRQVSVMQVHQSSTEDLPEALEVKLPMGTKPTDGDKVAARQADAHPGYHLVQFEPHVGKAILARLNDDELRCRGAVATALSVKPWDVMVAQRRDGGFSVQLPGAYVPSKHDGKLQEVAETAVGRFGWYVTIDTRNLVAQIIPSSPPTFPDLIPLELGSLGAGTLDRTPFARKLPAPGQKEGGVASIDWTMSPYVILGGLPRAGKSVSLNDVIADALSNGAELVISTTPDKAVDFTWCKPYVRDGGWGCDGLRSTVTALRLAHETLSQRSLVLKERRLENWYQIPEAERFKPILVVVDEVSRQLMTDRLPAGVDKSSPEVQEIVEQNLLKFRIQKAIYDLMAEMGFVGARVMLSSQVTNAATGLPPTMKALIGNKMLQGANPSKAQREQAFNVAAQVPIVPENLRGGGPAAKGVGAAELEGQDPFIYKPFFTPIADISARLAELDLPRTSRPEPTVEEMDRLCPAGEEADLDAEPDAVTIGERSDFGKEETPVDEDGKPLKGAAAAAKASTPRSGPPCPSCEKPIDPTTGECGCSW